MKHGIITVTIQGATRNKVDQDSRMLMKAIREATEKTNGTRIRQSYTNGDDAGELQGLMGQLKWWTLPTPQFKDDGHSQHKGWLGQLRREIRKLNLGKQAREIFEKDVEDL